MISGWQDDAGLGEDIAQQRPIARRLLALVVILATVFLCMRMGPETASISHDNQIYYFIAERAASGEPPHVSTVEHKTVLASLISAAAMRVGRATGVHDVMATRVVSIAIAALTVAGVGAIAFRFSGSLAMSLLASGVMLTFHDYIRQAVIGVRPKVFMTFFLVAALLAYADRKRMRSGAYSIAAFACWQPGLLVFGSIGLASLIERDRWRAAFQVATGGLLAFLAYEAYFVYHGIAGEQLFQNFLMAADRGVPGVSDPKPDVAFLLSLGFNREAETLRDFIVSLTPTLRTFFTAVALVGAAVGLWRLVRHPRIAGDALRDQPWIVALYIGAATTAWFTLVEHQAWPDRFFILPFIAVGAGWVFGAFSNAIAAAPQARAHGLLTTAAAVFVFSAAGIAAPRANIQGATNSLEDQIRAAEKIAEMGERFGSVMVFGCPHLLALTRTPNHDRFSSLFDGRMLRYMQDSAEGEFYEPLKDGELPAVVVITRIGSAREKLKWLDERYARYYDADLRRQHAHAWVRRDTIPPGVKLPTPPKRSGAGAPASADKPSVGPTGSRTVRPAPANIRRPVQRPSGPPPTYQNEYDPTQYGPSDTE